MKGICRCGESDPEKFFPSQQYTCKACTTAQARAWKLANPERTAEILRRSREKHPDRVERNHQDRRFRRYGLTRESYGALLEAQGGVCAICKGSDWGRGQPHIDHNHTTNKVRGLLCTRCNVMLGYAREDIAVLQRAVDYLTRF